MKTCNKCNIGKELSEFYKDLSRADGKTYQCKDCIKGNDKTFYLKYKNIKIQRRLDNIKKYKERDKKYYLDNKKRMIKNSIQYHKQRRQIDPLFKISDNIRSLIHISFKKGNSIKSLKTEQILGCSINEFINHLQSQFIHPMFLENYGLIWEIDHITPISSAKTEEDIITLNHYTNLRPLFKTTEIAEQYGYDIVGNRNKGNRISLTMT
jgi:hypothetical protein